MATNPIGGSPSPVTFPNQLPPMPAVARILSRFDREQLHGFIAVAIDLADALDGDPDLEGECSEDEVSRCTDLGLPVRHDGAGCEISDPGGCEHDGREVTGAEDDFMDHGWSGPGCPISDPGGGDEGI